MVKRMPSILVVDDDAELRFVLRSFLEPAGYMVHEAGDGTEAMDVYRESVPDVVLTDMIMQPTGGQEFLENLFDEHPDARAIVMTGFHQGIVDASSLGVRAVLEKPFSGDTLESAIRSALEDRE